MKPKQRFRVSFPSVGISCVWLCAFYLRIWLALSLRGTLGSRDDQDDRPLQNYSEIFRKLYGVVLTFFFSQLRIYRAAASPVADSRHLWFTGLRRDFADGRD